MSLPEQIAAWLEDGYYPGGVAILRQAPGVSFRQLRFFEGYLKAHYVPTAVERELRELIERLAAALPGTGGTTETTVVSASETPETVAETADVPSVEAPSGKQGNVRIAGAVSGSFWGPFFAGLDEVPEEISSLYRRAIGLHKRQSENHALLRQAAEGGDRKRTLELSIERMEEIEPELDRLYDAAREWKEKGTLPAPELRSTDVAEAEARWKREKYLRERRSRVNGWLSRGEHPRRKGGVRSWVKITPAEADGYRQELLDIEDEILKIENGN